METSEIPRLTAWATWSPELLDPAHPTRREMADRGLDRIVLAVPDLNNSESSLLATWAADGVVVVVDDHEGAELRRAQSLIARTDAELLGSIKLTDAVLD